MTRRMPALIAALMIITLLPVAAQDDTTLTDVDETTSTIRRKPNGEWMLGVQRATYSTESLYNGEPVPGTEKDYGYTYFGVGYGGHIPLTEVGTYGTIWFVASANAWLNIGDESTVDEYGYVSSDASVGFDLSIPVHATIGYGGLRRKSMAWGIEGGLGLNSGLRTRSSWESSAFTFAPSALIDITYAPKNIFRLRFMGDILPGSLSDTESYRTWSVQLVIGIL